MVVVTSVLPQASSHGYAHVAKVTGLPGTEQPEVQSHMFMWSWSRAVDLTQHCASAGGQQTG